MELEGGRIGWTFHRQSLSNKIWGRVNTYPSQTISNNHRRRALPSSFYKATITQYQNPPKISNTYKKKITGQYH